VKIDRRFPIRVGITLGVGLSVAMVVLFMSGDRELVVPVVVGAALSTVNVLAGFFAVEYSLERSYTTMLKAVLGGMGIRLVVMLGIFILLVKVVGLHAAALVVSLLSFYVVYLVLEVLYIQERVSHKSKS
jgi:hypothetical protein